MTGLNGRDKLVDIIENHYLSQGKKVSDQIIMRFMKTVPITGISCSIGLLSGVSIVKKGISVVNEETVRELLLMEEKGIKIPVRLSMYNPQGEVYNEEIESFTTIANALLWIKTLENDLIRIGGRITERTFTSTSLSMAYDCSAEIEIIIPEEVEEMFCPKAVREASEYLLAQLQLLNISPLEFDDEFKLIKEAGEDVEVSVYGPDKAWSIENTATNEVIIDQESLECYKKENGEC